MDNVKSDEYYINKIKLDLLFIEKHMNNISIDELDNDEVLLDSMLFRMIQVSENAKHLTNEYKKQHHNIPWSSISGLRNRVVHDYGTMSVKIIYETLTKDIPMLKEAFENS